MDKVKYGVIGLGWFGGKHAEVLSQIPNIELYALCTRTESRLEELAKEFGVKKTFTDYNEMLADPELEAVSITTMWDQHAAPTIAALEAGKNVFCEKPMASTREDCAAIVKAANAAKGKFMVGHIVRFNPRYAMAKREIAEGKVGKKELLEVEAAAYHAPGTCTFFGTANSNQMFMEVMGLHLPGASFVNPGTALRDALTAASARRLVKLTRGGESYTPLAEIVDERALVNAMVGLLATGGSTNHTIHLVAIARAAGIHLSWDDFDELSQAVPLLARVYPNGTADVNHFHRAGGLAFLIGQLLDAGLLHPDVRTVAGDGLDAYRDQVRFVDGRLVWQPPQGGSRDRDVLRPFAEPFQPTGGLRLVTGNLGRAVIKISALKPEHRRIEAPAVVFDRQEDLNAAFTAGELDRDFVAVVRFQGPRANGMPELHKLMPGLGVLQDRGHRVALVTDGRLSGASGKVPAAIHVTPEAAVGGPLARVRSGDVVAVDPEQGTLEVKVDETAFAGREAASPELDAYRVGLGRELFTTFRAGCTGAEQGATSFGAVPGW